MKSISRALFFLILTSPLAPLFAETPMILDNSFFPNLSKSVDATARPATPETITQQRMTLVELQDFFGNLDRGRPVRLIYKNGSEYAGSYSGSETNAPMIYCKKGLTRAEPVPLETVTDAYVYVEDNHLVRIHRLD